MSHLFLVRHGISYFNEKNLFTGTLDVPLTEKGVLQSRKLASIISCSLDIVFTSTLLRSIETSTSFLRELCPKYNQIPIFLSIGQFSDVLEKNILPVYKTDLLNERNYGCLQGMVQNEVNNCHTQAEMISWRTTMYASPSGGECLRDVKERTDLFYNQYLKKYLYTSKNIAIICHQNTIKTLRMELELNNYTEKLLKNCEVLEYTFKPHL